jgi:hypothetical protein
MTTERTKKVKYPDISMPEIEDNEFEPDSKLQDEMNHKFESISSEGDLRAKELWVKQKLTSTLK